MEELTDKSWLIYLSLSKYGAAIKKTETAGTEKLEKFKTMMNDFLDRFDWVLRYTAADIAEQEKQGSKRFTGVCYDACKYLAQKLEDVGIAYKSYWICGTGIESILDWLSGQTLHSFNLCEIGGVYYFADCFYASILSGDNRLWGFSNEKDALAWAAETLLRKSPFVLKEFNPLAVKTGSHIVYSLRRLLNLKD